MKKISIDAEKKTRFTLAAEPGSVVFVAGSFNAWSPTANRLKARTEGGGHFETSLRVPKGTSEYKFVVNGVWIVDPACLHRTPNAHGSSNSVVYV